MSTPNGTVNGGQNHNTAPTLLSNAAHFGDMNHVWSLVEELSGLLQSNRAQWNELEGQLVSRSQTFETLQAVGAPTENTGANADADNVSEQIAENTSAVNRNTQDSPLESRAQLTKNLAEAEQYINTLDKAYQDQSELVLSYENGMQSTTAKLRDYIYEQQQATLAIHSHYTSLLQASRNETMQAQLTHQAWQTSFSRVSETLREALKHHTLVTAPYKRKVAALKEENRTLRARVGWDPPSDSEDELEGRFEKERATAPLVSENVTALP